MKKKAQGLSLNTIIIAAIVLIVLVVLWAIFTGRMGVFTRGVKDAEAQLECASDIVGGEPTSRIDDEGNLVCPGDTTKIPGKFKDVNPETQICCTKPA